MAKADKQTKAVKNPYQRTAHVIMHTAGKLQNKMTQALREYDISEPQYKVLSILHRENKPMNLFEIQGGMAQKDSNVSRIIDKLAEKQFVIRKVSKENRRKVDIAITPKGAKTLNAIEPAIEKVLGDLFEGVKKDKIKTLGKLLDVLTTSHKVKA